METEGFASPARWREVIQFIKIPFPDHVESEIPTSLCPCATSAGQGCVLDRLLRRASLFLALLIHLGALYVLQPSRVNCSQTLFKFLHLSLNGPKWTRTLKTLQRTEPRGRVQHLKLGFGSTPKLDHDGQQRLIDSGLGELVAVTFPAFLQLLKTTLTHGEERQRRCQVAPLTLRPVQRSWNTTSRIRV